MTIRIASLFTGVGGAEIGFSRAFGEQNIEHVAFAEYDKFASQVLASRFPGAPNFGDVIKIDWASFPKCDILHASPPCQAFSVAGKQKGMDDDRGLPMWNAYFSCMEAVRPPIITLEEVPALVSKKFEKEWAWILSEWARLGYYVKFTKIQALDHGVPQSRLRLIVVGFLDKARCDAFEWPEPRPRTKKLKDILQPEDEVDAKYYLKAEGILKLLGKMNDEQVGRLLGLASPAGELINHGTVVPQEDVHANCVCASYFKGPDNHGERTMVAVIRHVNDISGPAVSEHVPSLRASGGTGIRKQPVVAIISQPHGTFEGSVDAEKIGSLRSATPDNQRVAIVHPVTLKEMDHANTLRNEGDCALDAKHVNRHVGVVKCVNPQVHQDYRVYDQEGVSPTLASNRGGGSAKHPYIVCRGGDGKPCVLFEREDKTLLALFIRRLTCVETCRLMGWPDDWNAEVSNSQRYRQCGNGLVSNVIAALAPTLTP
ncbi:MAG: DNA (cytosine-5-)-methyltransferase [Sphaerochaeta sp.]|jgi:DNA (cytosine-5)-methyltransferase 1|nr:DNA (cytosine-5-)-methyltransferase [Sphaerochaeta sp.]